MQIQQLTGSIVLLLGSIFLFLGALGVLRMPDSYNRIQTGTKATTLGTMLSMVGIGFLHPSWFTKLFVLIFFMVITNPISSHVLANVMYALKVPVKKKKEKGGHA